jgi:hypothetical protein
MSTFNSASPHDRSPLMLPSLDHSIGGSSTQSESPYGALPERQSFQRDVFEEAFVDHPVIQNPAADCDMQDPVVDGDLALFTGFAYESSQREEGRQYSCPVGCGELFKRHYDVQRHVDSVHR